MILRKRFQYACIFILAVACEFKANAQTNPYNEVSIASPTAASLGKYADIPVNYHTGIPDISIPIYTVKEGTLSLPISLSYHASGLRVMEAAGWVGAGWAMNAGGVITRTVRGAPDEKGTSNVTTDQPYGYFSDYGWANYIEYVGDVDAITPGSDFQSGRRDGEPDLFSFNLGGYSGKFYFRDDRTPIFEPQQDFKLDYNYSGTGSIQSFTLTAPDGTKYYFGGTAIERTNPVSGQTGYMAGTVISSWYLYKIESSDSQFAINLNYVTETYSYFTLSMFPIEGNDNTNYEYSLIKNIVTGVRLSNITSSNGKVDFIANTVRQDLGSNSLAFTDAANTNAKCLDTIKISDNANAFSKKWRFSYSYFTDNTPLKGYFSSYGLTTDAKRLKLDQVQELSGDGLTQVPPYAFTYFTEKVPRRLSFAQDHWGFYNGADNNTKLIPTYSVTYDNQITTYNGANREPSWPAMRGGALSRISYPTGGFTDFNFESNDTWAVSTVTNPVARFQMVLGYSNNSPTLTQSQTFTGNSYRISLINNGSTGSLATVTIRSGSTALFTAAVDPGTSKTVYFQPPAAGVYSVTVAKNNIPSPYTSNGFTASFDELVASVYSRNEIVGGLRIKTMTHNDGVGAPDIITSYDYSGDNGQSTGVLYSRPTYVQIIRSDEIKEAGIGGPTGTGPAINTCNPNGCINCDWSGSSMYFQKSPCGIRPLSTSQGNHVGYNQVKVSQAGNGYSLYMYYGSDRWDNVAGDLSIKDVKTDPPCNPSLPSFPYAPLPYEPLRGQLKYEGYFSEGNKLLKEAYHYYSFTNDATTTPGIIVANAQWWVTTYYNIQAVHKLSDSTVTYNYSPSGAYLKTKTENFYESNFHFQTTRSQTTNSEGDILSTKYTYSNDIRINKCDTISGCWANYNTAVQDYTTQYVSAKFGCSTDGCIYNNYQTYRENLKNARVAYVTCRKANYTDPIHNNFKSCIADAKLNAGPELKPILELQSNNQVVPIEVSGWKNNQLTSALFYRYDYTGGEVYPQRVQSIKISQPSNTFTKVASSGNNLTKDSRYTEDVNLSFSLGNISGIKKRTEPQKSYIWGYNNNFPIAQTINALPNEILFKDFESGGWDANMQYDNTTYHSGAKSGKIVKTTTGELYSMSNTWLTVDSGSVRKFRYSGWVYSNGPSVDIYLFMKKAGEPGYFTYVTSTSTSTANKWVFLQKDYNVPSNVTQLNVRVDNNGGGTVWFDDVRLHPADAQMTTYTYSPMVGMTSEADINNRFTYYEYDNLGRLKLMKDQDGNIIKTFDYNFKNTNANP